MVKQQIAGYSGYVPRRKFDSIAPRPPEIPTADISGYSGYIFARGPENVYGKTFTLMSKEIKCSNKYRDRENFEDIPSSIFKESYINPSEMDGKHNICPTDKKFIKRTNFDYDKDFNLAADCRARIMSSEKLTNISRIGKMLAEPIQRNKSEKPKPLKLYPPIVGYNAHNRQVHVGNLYAKDWQICRSQAADRIVKNRTKQERMSADPEVSLMTSETAGKPYTHYAPVTGYKGFVSRVGADNIYGCTYQTAIRKGKESETKLGYWKSLEETTMKSFPAIPKAPWK
jgi:hypothetical protein